MTTKFPVLPVSDPGATQNFEQLELESVLGLGAPTANSLIVTDAAGTPAWASATWASYTPAWTSSGTQPTVGNGVLNGKYVKVGKIVHFQVHLSIGTTTTNGTGLYTFSVPVAGGNLLSGWMPIGVCSYLDSGVEVYGGHIWHNTTTTVTPQIQVVGASLAPSRQISATHPVVPSSTDEINISGTYEAA